MRAKLPLLVAFAASVAGCYRDDSVSSPEYSPAVLGTVPTAAMATVRATPPTSMDLIEFDSLRSSAEETRLSEAVLRRISDPALRMQMAATLRNPNAVVVRYQDPDVALLLSSLYSIRHARAAVEDVIARRALATKRTEQTTVVLRPLGDAATDITIVRREGFDASTIVLPHDAKDADLAEGVRALQFLRAESGDLPTAPQTVRIARATRPASNASAAAHQAVINRARNSAPVQIEGMGLAHRTRVRINAVPPSLVANRTRQESR